MSYSTINEDFHGLWIRGCGTFPLNESIGLKQPIYTSDGINMNFFENLAEMNWKDGNLFVMPTNVKILSDAILVEEQTGIMSSTDMINTSDYNLKLNDKISLAPPLTKDQEFKVRTHSSETTHIFPLTVPRDRYMLELHQLDVYLYLYNIINTMVLSKEKKGQYLHNIAQLADDNMSIVHSNSNSGNLLWGSAMIACGTPSKTLGALDLIYSLADENIFSKYNELNNTTDLHRGLDLLIDHTAWNSNPDITILTETLNNLRHLCNSSMDAYRMSTQAKIKKSLEVERYSDMFYGPFVSKGGKCIVNIIID
jgi:hypothetical protein